MVNTEKIPILLELITIRRIAKDNKDFIVADRLKSLIEQLYKIILSDTPEGTVWTQFF